MKKSTIICMRMGVSIVMTLGLFLASCASEQKPEIPPGNTGFVYPISAAQSRVTKKPFAIHVTPASSPVSPERFSGYHTGEDFETFASEQDTDVWISAICKGSVRFTGWVKGYGGVLIEQCTYHDAEITVLYGHLKIDSVSLRTGDTLAAGAGIGILGKGYTSETDNERKHLHLAIHKGSELNYRGYVATEKELDQWIDPFPF